METRNDAIEGAWDGRFIQVHEYILVIECPVPCPWENDRALINRTPVIRRGRKNLRVILIDCCSLFCRRYDGQGAGLNAA